MEKKKEIKQSVHQEGMRENVIYIGPSFREGGLSRYMGFVDGVPALYENDPVFRHLFVKPENLNQAMADEAHSATFMHTMCVKALTKINEVRAARAPKAKEE